MSVEEAIQGASMRPTQIQPGGRAVSVDEQTLEFGAITGKGSVRSRRTRARPIRVGGPERLAAADIGDEFPPPTIAALCDEFAEICESAVDALEIASALEFAGISDRTARLRYGAGVDVFVLAQEMYFRVPRRPAEPEPPPDPWRQVSKFQPALRGLLYALPAACVLLVLGAQRWLLAALVPAVLASAAYLLLHKPAGLVHVAWAGLAVTVIAALVLAIAFTRRISPSAGRLLVAAELRAALPAVGFGLVAAGLLIFPVLAGPGGHGGVNVGALLVAVPLSLSMGTAEWSLLRYRRRTQRLLRATLAPRKFGRRARLALLGALLEYVAGAVALTAAAIGIAAVTGLVHPRWALMPEVGTYLALGAAMFLALLLQAVRARGLPLAAAATALAVEVTFRDHGLPVQVAAATGLLVVVGGYAAVVLGRAVRNAY